MAKWDLIQVCYIIKSTTYPSQQLIKEKKHMNTLIDTQII